VNAGTACVASIPDAGTICVGVEPRAWTDSSVPGTPEGRISVDAVPTDRRPGPGAPTTAVKAWVEADEGDSAVSRASAPVAPGSAEGNTWVEASSCRGGAGTGGSACVGEVFGSTPGDWLMVLLLGGHAGAMLPTSTDRPATAAVGAPRHADSRPATLTHAQPR
jgi:hypothetical protein